MKNSVLQCRANILADGYLLEWGCLAKVPALFFKKCEKPDGAQRGTASCRSMACTSAPLSGATELP